MGRLADLAEEEIREAFYKKARELGVPLADLPADAIELIYTTFRLDYLGVLPADTKVLPAPPAPARGSRKITTD
ncbi:MAG: hypothetical protein GYA36_19330 [Veillonellaceae bacterium]|nr:hypothetical protein [Veillonellaceae bacterium]